MSSDVPQTNLWLERSRLAGMMLEGVSYGIFLILTVQSLVALMRRPRDGGHVADHRPWLILYILITFALGTMSTAIDAKYIEMIWIDLRNAPGGPLMLIEHPFKYHINLIALSCDHIQVWFMQALLLYRCFVIWNWARFVTIPMTTGYITMIALSTIIQVESRTGDILHNLKRATELAYVCTEVGLTVAYTILVVYRLQDMRKQMRQIVDKHGCAYDTVVRMIVESAMAYTLFALVYIIAFALHNNGLIFLCCFSIGKLQGIAQLLIILRVAKGRAVTQEWSTRIAAAGTTIIFSRSAADATEESKDAEITEPQQSVIHTYCALEKSTDGDMSDVKSA